MDREFYIISASFGLVISLIFTFCTLTGLSSVAEVFDTAYYILVYLGCIYIFYHLECKYDRF